MVMHEYGVTFMAGTSGHLVGNVLANLVRGDKVEVTDVGSVHAFADWNKGFFYRTIFDHNPNSEAWQKFEVDMVDNSQPTFVFMMHCMNLELVSRHCKSVVYIDFPMEDLNKYVYRYLMKIPYEEGARRQYEKNAGADWPSYEEYVRDPSLIIDEYIRTISADSRSWKWLYPVDTTSLHKVQFEEISTGEFIPKLASFLGVTSYDASYLDEVLTIYNSKQPDKYQYGNTERTQARGI